MGHQKDTIKGQILTRYQDTENQRCKNTNWLAGMTHIFNIESWGN